MNYLFLFVSSLFFASSAAFNNETIEAIQYQILAKINETEAPDFEECNDTLLQKAKFGDLIEIKRKGYFHWAFFIRNRTVIQLNNPDFDKLNVHNALNNFTGEVELRNIIELAGDDPCRINNKQNEAERRGWRVLPKTEILKKIRHELKNNVTNYNLLTYNCEHFAVKMRFGIPFSSQIEAMKQILKNIPNKLAEMLARLFKVAANSIGIKNRSHEGLIDMSSFKL